MKSLIQQKLKWLARRILKKYRPKVVALSGSVGKTSAKAAVYAVVAGCGRVRTSQKNYNNEFGLPLTIIGADSPGRSWLGWAAVIGRAFYLLLRRDKNYPDILILEMGIDRPGDMAYLVSIATPDIGIMTGVSHSHLEYFGSVANIKKEKQVLIEHVDNQGLSILNYDNEHSRDMASASKARVLTYGLQAGANLQAQDIIFNFTRGNYELAGVNFKLNYNGSIVPVFMSHIVTETALYAALAGAAVGLHFGLNLVDVAKALADFSLPPGRMNILPGIKHTFIIDDTYNASPESSLAALDILGRIRLDEGAAKRAVLGDMLELGSYTEEGHWIVGAKAARAGVAELILVGERSRDIGRGAIEAGFSPEKIYNFSDARPAGHFLQERLRAGDIVLVKGSQGMRMEKVVQEVMAEPGRAKELLVRQGEEWSHS